MAYFHATEQERRLRKWGHSLSILFLVVYFSLFFLFAYMKIMIKWTYIYQSVGIELGIYVIIMRINNGLFISTMVVNLKRCHVLSECRRSRPIANSFYYGFYLWISMSPWQKASRRLFQSFDFGDVFFLYWLPPKARERISL